MELILGEAYMFSGSILENIELNKKIPFEQLKEICANCEVDYDINNFKEGYETLIGEKGVKLSGGQKQRICLARGLASSKPIIILDESFNKLDNNTKKHLLTNLKDKYKDKTMLYISNDLEIINYADNIIYIDGKTTIKGSHKELFARSQNYRNLITIKENII